MLKFHNQTAYQSQNLFFFFTFHIKESSNLNSMNCALFPLGEYKITIKYITFCEAIK